MALLPKRQYIRDDGSPVFFTPNDILQALLPAGGPGSYPTPVGPVFIRNVLSSPTNFYYKPSTGSDTTGDGSISNPWASSAPLFRYFDFGNQAVTLNLQENTAVPLALQSWAGAGSLTVDLGTHSIISTTGSAIVALGALPGITTIKNGTIGATGTQFAAGLDMHLGGGLVQMTGITFNGCTFAYVWGSSSGGGAPATNWLDSITLASNTSLSPAQTCAIFSGGAASFLGGFNRTLVVNATGNLAFSQAFSIQTIAISTFQGAGGQAAVWNANGHTVTYPNANVANVPGQGLSDFAGFH